MRELIDRLRQNKIHVSLDNENLKLKFDHHEIPNLLLEEIKKNKVEILQFLKDNSRSYNLYTPIDPAPVSESYPLSASQYRLWILSQFQGGSVAYNIPAAVRIKGRIDILKFEKSFKILINRHEILRTEFKTNEDGENRQYIVAEESLNFRITCKDYSLVEDQEAMIADYLERENSIPFDLTKDLLLRVCLIKLKEDDYVLFLSLHHIIVDGWSMELLISEIIKIYNALIKEKEIDLPNLKIQYKDYAVWLNSSLQQEKYKASEQYWLNQFKGELPILDLPGFKPRPQLQTYNGDRLRHKFSKRFSDKIKLFSKENDVTVFMILMTGINSLLYRYTGQNDIVLGTPIAGREHPDLENQIGLYLNTLAIRTQFEKNLSFLDLLNKEKKVLLEAYKHQSYPFDALVGKLHLKRDASRSALFDVIIDFKSVSETDIAALPRLEGIEISEYDFKNKVAKVDLNFTFIESKELDLVIDYNTDIYDAYSIEKMFAHFENLVMQLLDNPDSIIETIQYLTDKEKNQLLIDFNNTEIYYLKEKTIIDLFEEQVSKAPENIALVFEGKQLTYREFNIKVNQLADCLIKEYGIKEGDTVGTQLNKNEWAIISILGILKAGAVFVPIEPELPAARKSFVAEDAGIKLLITEVSYLLDLGFYEGAVFAIDVEFESSEFNANFEKLEIDVKNLAYVIYTSGSTGNPKGVMIEHESLSNYLYWAKSAYLEGGLSNTNFGLFTSLSFDLTLTSLFLPLVSGGSLYLFDADKEISNILKQYFQSKISCVKLTPSHISILESLGIKDSNIELVIVGGEELRRSHVNTLREINPKIKIYNEYGPTEATVGCVVYEVKPNDESILIGTPISNTSILILDEYQGLQSQGKSGEIYISGSGLARGYINNPELTSEKFIHNPFMQGRMYKTGDLGYWLPDGNIKFLGRKDHQVKIRGHRIELEEIENQILEYSEDLKHVVVTVKESNADKNLVAYFVSDSVIDKSELRAFLNENLPDYMVPGFYVALTELPLTSNGKIDRNSLPDVDSQDIIKNKYIAPRNETEEDLIKIWEEVLGIEKIGISDNFFELGGHSLVMVQVINRLYKKSGKSISFSDFFKNPTIESLADQLKDDTYIAIENTPEMESYPMSPSQERFWILSQLEGGSLAYNIPAAVKFEGKINADKLEESFRLLIKRHEILRTNFKTNDEGENRQYITAADLFAFALSRKDFSLENNPEESLQSYLKENNNVIFNLEKDLLIRASLIKLEEETYVFYLSMHHIIGDGWSMELLIAEIVKSYNALIAEKEITLPVLTLQYKDYAVWLNAVLQQEKQKHSEQYWFNQFSGEISVLNLPGFKTRPLVKTYNGDRVSYEFSTELTDKIKAFSQDQDVTIFMTLMAAVNTLLHRYTNQYDIIVGTPVAGREHPDLENQLGLYLNTLAIRTQLKEEMNFSELLDLQKETLLSAYEHQNYPFDSLVGKLNLSRDTSRSALFDVLVVLQNQGQLNNLNTEELSNIQVSGYGLINKISKFDLSFTFMENQRLSLLIEYNTDIYDSSLIARMFLHLENIFLALLSNPEISISKIDYLSAEEKQQLLLTFNNNKTDYPKDKTIIELFEEQALHTPNNIAVVFEDIKLTFKELNEKANQLGRYLREQYQIKADDLVGIKLDRNEKTIIAMLGILKSGAAYVPIDINYPEERIAYIEQDSKSKVVINDEELKRFNAIKGQYSTENPEKINHANDLVYVIYTSGTTGNPKGVMVEHKNVIRLVRQTNFIATDEIGNILSLSNFSFDGSVFDIFSALLNGTALIIPVQNSYLDMSSLGKLIKDQNVNTFFITTALFNNLTDSDLDLKNIRYVLFGGELVSVNHTLKFKNKYPWIHLIHVYGPTENTVFSSYYEVKNVEVSQDTIPIGKAIANSDCYILSANNELQPIGSVGEICVGGDGLARGYLNQPALTATKFVPHPFKIAERIYKSGDLGRLLPDGNIEFLNRNDHQVKIRGFRIEPGEIESIILQYSESLKQVFVAVKQVNKEKVLVAYLVSDDLDKSKLRQYLQEKLPEYMIPGFYIVLKELPLTSNGKVDTKTLPEISGEDIVLKEYIAPRNETEQKLALIWQNVLGLEKIGILDNFFELGGHSLMVAQVINQIHKQLGKTVSFKVFFESQTIEKISRQLQGNAYIAIPKAATEESYPLSAAQYRLWILSQFEGGSLAYNISTAIRLTGLIEADKFEESFKLLINRHEILRTNFKTNEAGEIRQYVVPAASVDFKIIQEDFTLTTNKEEAINAYLQKKNSIPFDLENGPLIRASLIKLKEQEFVFCLSIHHIIGDGWSIELLVSEIVKAYNALLQSKKIDLADLSIQYKDYAVWNNDELQQNKHVISEQYWLNKFQGELPILELPAFKTRPVVQTYNGETKSHRYSKSFLDKLKSFSKESDVTLFMTLMTGINALLHRYTGHNDIILGTPIAGRDHPDLENQLGLYVNTLAIRTQFKENGSFLDLLAHEKEILLEAYEHQSYPFDQLVGKLDLIRDTSRSALFDVMVVLQNQNQLNNINSGEELTNLEISNYLLENKTSQFDMSFTFSEDDGLKLAIEYNTDIYENDFIKEIFSHFEFLLTQLLENSAAPVESFSYLCTEEKEQLLFEFNDTSVYYPKDKSVIDLFENQVCKTPDNIAVVFEGASLTYKELNEKSNQLAGYLTESGVTVNTHVFFYLERGIDYLVCMLGVWKSGAYFTPLDVEVPLEKNKRTIGQVKDCFVVTTQNFVSQAQEMQADATILVYDDSIINQYSKDNHDVVLLGDSLSYIIFTSGSTGIPKGAMVEHSGMLNHLLAKINDFNITASDNVAQTSTHTFDVSIWQFTVALLVGGKTTILTGEDAWNPKKLLSHIAANSITIFESVPAHFSILLDFLSKEQVLPDLKAFRYLMMNGEALPVEYCKKWFEYYPSVSMANVYGPTECSDDITHHIFESCLQDWTGYVPIGKPIQNMHIYILDKNLNLVPKGVTGDLYTSGAGVGKGYLNDDEKTKQVFIANPYCRSADDKVLYKTGDLAKWLADGTLDFAGRADEQVKIRGIRIELGEIETELAKSPLIKHNRIVVKEDASKNKFLVAYIVPNGEFNKESIQDFLKEHLPNYMVPGFYVALSELPLTPNGKVDLKKLPNISEQDVTKSEYAAPRSKEEKLLVNVWEDVLKRSPISVKDNFYNLGGDSIKSIQIISRLKQQGYSLKIKDILRVAVLEQLAKHMEVSNRIIDQSPVEGEIAFTPIQHYFFENNIFKVHHHFNQSVVLKSGAELNSDFLSKSLTFLVHHHDALRMIYKKEGDNWKQYNKGIQKDDLTVDFHDLRNSDDELLAMAKIGEQLQSGFNLEGSLLKAAHFRLTSGDRVALIIHHLVVDGVSWRILLEDLSVIYTQLLSGAAVQLPLKTDSFKLWSSLQQDYAHGEQIKLEKPYWESVSSQVISSFPTDKNSREFNVKIDSSISFSLNKYTTELLQTKVHGAYNTEINDILLTGLGLSLKNVFGLDKSILKMEGHGREEIIPDVDINRTVGWFTSFYPFVLDVSNPDSNTLIKVKEDLRKIPNKGVGYGILKYLTKQYSDKLIPAIEFNYLGDFGSGVTNKNEDSIFEYASEYIGANNDDSNGNDVLLIVTGILVDEKLSITINFNKEVYHKKTIQDLVDSYKENLVALIEELSAIRENYLTPSDLTFKKISISTLSELNKDNDIEDIYKLSPLQQGIYFHWLSNGMSSLYFEQISYRIKASDLDITDIKEAYDKLITRHAVLRTGFKYDQTNELPIQIVRKTVSGNFLHKKLPSSVIDLNEYVEKIKLEDRNKGFDLESTSQMRLQILDLGNDNYEFIWSHHHILADGWCMSILIKDFYQILNSISQKSVLNLPKTFPYSNYIKWLDSVNTNDSMTYWKNYLEGYNQIAEIPFGKTIQEDQKYTEAKETATIGENLYKKINSLCASIGVTQNTFIQVVWGFLLSRYNNTQDVVFGSVVSGRPGELEGIEDMIGLFINTIPVRIKYADVDTPYDLLKRVQEDAIYGSTYHYSNLAEINAQSELGMKLFNHIMIFENYPIQDILENGVKNSQINQYKEIKIESVATFEQTNYDFDISILPSSSSLAIDFKYNTKRYESKFMKNLVEHIYNLIEQFTEHINKPLNTFNYLSTEEKEQLLFEFNDTSVYYPKDKSVIDLFENQVCKTPDNIAVVFEGASLTYKELNEKSNQLAGYLTESGVTVNTHVFFYLERGIDYLVCMLGVWKSGAYFTPLDVEVPLEKNKRTIGQVKDCFVVTTQNFVSQAQEMQADATILVYDDSIINQYSKDNHDVVLLGDSLSYIIFTSGSTGIPKGAMVEHSGMLNHLWAKINDFNITASDNVAQTSTHTFDVSIWQFTVALLVGGKTTILTGEDAWNPKKLLSHIAANSITIFESVPAHFSILLDFLSKEQVLPDLKAFRYLMMNGEALPVEYCKKWFEYYPSVSMANVYGPTECSDDITHHIFESCLQDWTGYVPIGKPIQNMHIYILDKNLNLVPKGVTGDLYTSGAGVGKGYLNDDEKTKQVFIANPYCRSADDKVLYKTGDLAKWLADGTLDFAGRADEQVKIRGIRIELGEIETELAKSPLVKHNRIVVKEDASKNKFLVAYIVPNGEFNKESIQDFLKERLPNYMVPGFYVALSELPLTPNGKVDLKKLPNISEQDVTSNYAAPTTPLEEKLAAIWQEVLGIERIGITDNFFEMGGHSLIVIQVINKINQQLGRDISFKDFFLNPTIEKIDKLLEEKTFAGIQKAPLSESYPLTLAQTQYWLMNQTGDVLKAYDITNTFKIHGNIDVEIFEEAFNLLIKRHEILRTYFKVNSSGVVNQYVGKEDVYYKINNHDFINKKPSQVLELLDKVTNEDFDLEKLPLIKNHLLKVDQNEYVFFISLYHIIADGWSLDIIMKEVLDFYKQLKNKEKIILPELKIQYKDYVLWLIENEQEKKFEIAENFWIEKFKGEIPVINIPTVKTRPAVKTYNGKNLEYKFSEDFYRAFKLFNNKHDVTSFISLNAVLNILLFTKSMQDDIIIGTPVSGRNHPELENLVGLFTNVLALRTKINTDSPFAAFLELHKKTILESFDNQIYPFYSLIEKLKLKRDLSRSGLFDVMMNLNTVNNNVEIDPFDEFEIEGFNTVNDTSQFDLNFVFTEFDALNLIIQFNTDVFEDIEIEIMMKDFDKIMTKIFQNENILIKDLQKNNKDISKRNENKLNKFLKR